jgi:hypothetical protein
MRAYLKLANYSGSTQGEKVVLCIIISMVKTIVCFLDILGYESLVTKMIEDAEFIKRFDDLMYGITIGLKEDLSNLERPDLSDEEKKYFEKVVSSIKVRCIYDNIIFSLPLSDIAFNSTAFDEHATVLNRIKTFFSLIAAFATLFIATMGHLLRGGISVGTHFESERENYLFLFSEAHNKAVHLEEQAEYARILLDDNLRSLLQTMGFTHMDEFFYKDDDDRLCFDIYSVLPKFPNRQDALTHINKGLTLNIRSNTKNEKELKKLIHFAKYHNRKVGRDGMNFPQLSINISVNGT